MSKHKVQVRRVYDDPAPGDGNRVLVDRIWPRGMTKEKAELDEWCKTIAPSTELRTWYHHDPQRFTEFTRRYHDELNGPRRWHICGSWPRTETSPCLRRARPSTSAKPPCLPRC